MKTFSFLFTTFSLLISLGAISCNSVERENKESEPHRMDMDVATVKYESKIVENSTRPGSKRLSEEAMASYLPASIGTFTKSGSPKFKEADVKLGRIYTRMTQSYHGDEGLITVMVTDFADDQNYVNEMLQGIQYADDPFSETHQNEKGWYITESFDLRTATGEDTVVTSRSLSIKNPRIALDFKVSPPLEEEAPPAEFLMQVFENSQFPKLFELPIPQGESSTPEQISPLLSLDCDALLPVEIVSRTCGVSGIEVFVNDFEKEKNCNRKYAYRGNLGGLILIVSQYAEAGMGVSAVQYHLSDETIPSEKIYKLGEAAVLQTVGDDLFLSIASGKFLVELRTFKSDLDKPEKCCVCFSETQLKSLASKVIDRLPK